MNRLSAQRHIVGASVPRLDIPSKVTGGEAFVQDMWLPGMVFDRVVRPYSYGAQLTALDDISAKAMPGDVAVLCNGRFLGVVARREEQAIAARTVLQRTAVWAMRAELGGTARSSRLLSKFSERLDENGKLEIAERVVPKALTAIIQNPIFPPGSARLVPSRPPKPLMIAMLAVVPLVAIFKKFIARSEDHAATKL